METVVKIHKHHSKVLTWKIMERICLKDNQITCSPVDFTKQKKLKELQTKAFLNS